MEFFESLFSPIGKLAGGAQNAFDDVRAQGKRRREEEIANKALQKAIDLERQRKIAQKISSQPVPEGEATVAPEWGVSERLKLHQAYGQAGIDPQKMAESQTARLAAQAFAEAIPNVTSDVGKINIGLNKEYKPNVYRKNELEADDKQLRLNTVQDLLDNPDINPLLAADIAQDKTVFNAEKVSIEGEDGQTVQGMATLMPSGRYKGSTIEDAKGKPLAIPVESGKPTTDMKNNKYYSELWGVSEADAATLLKSKTKNTPQEAWAKIVNAKSQNRFGNNVKPYDMLKNSMLVWSSARQGQALPVDVAKTIKSYGLNENQNTELLSLAENINSSVKVPDPVVPPAPASTPSLNQPFYNIPGLSAPAPQAPIAAITQSQSQPQQQPAETQPLSPVAIQTAWTAVQKGEDPKKVQAALEESGFDLSPEAVGMMAIDAVNSGVPANVLQQYLAAIGIEWQPEK